MSKPVISIVFLMACLAVAPLKAEEAAFDATTRKTPTTGYADENVEKCQFSTNAGTIADSTGALTPGMPEPKSDREGTRGF